MTDFGLSTRHLLALLQLPRGKAIALDWLQRPGAISLRKISPHAIARADAILKRCDRLGIEVLSYGDPHFPPRLRAIPDPPLVLYLLGSRESLLPERAIAVIGTRTPTRYGRDLAGYLGRRLAENDTVVVSGLAKGCDRAAHEGCLAAGGTTVAFVAHGLDTVYPPEHRELAARIVASGGALASEYSPGTLPQPPFFIERDRLQSGLSQTVIVVETEPTGGTMHTARFCLQHGRRLLCWQPPPWARSPVSRGNEQLLAGGAIPFTELAEIEAISCES